MHRATNRNRAAKAAMQPRAVQMPSDQTASSVSSHVAKASDHVSTHEHLPQLGYPCLRCVINTAQQRQETQHGITAAYAPVTCCCCWQCTGEYEAMPAQLPARHSLSTSLLSSGISIRSTAQPSPTVPNSSRSASVPCSTRPSGWMAWMVSMASSYSMPMLACG